jgi:hypothetical protein
MAKRPVAPAAVLWLLGAAGGASAQTPETFYFTGEMDITGRTFDLTTAPGGPWDLGSSYFIGGRLVSPGRTVEVRRTNSMRDGLVVNGTVLALNLDVVDSGDLVAAQNDVILENATVRLMGENSRVYGSSVLGTGEVVFDAPAVGAPGPNIRGTIIGPGITVRTGASGGGLVAFNVNNTFINDGRVISETPGTSIWTEHAVFNRGTIEARNGGTVVLSAGGTNQGTVRASDGGAIYVGAYVNRPFVNESTFAVEPTGFLDLGGTLSGNGVDLRGAIRPGGNVVTTGTIDVQSPLAFAPTTTLVTQLFGTGADRLDVAGEVRLDGTLRVESYFNGAVLPHRSFEVLRFGSRTGDFDAIVNATGFAGLTFTTAYDADSLTLTTDALDGDANLDGRVDGADVLLVRRNLGRRNRDWLSGDFDGNGRINLRDMELVRRNFGAQLPGLSRSSLQAVPEPAAPAVLLLLSAALPRRRRRSA